MKSKNPFTTPEFQQAHEFLQAHQSDPENIAIWNEMLKEERAEYWKSLPFFIVLMTLLPLAILIYCVAKGFFTFDAQAFLVPVLLPIGAFLISWPRRRW